MTGIETIFAGYIAGTVIRVGICLAIALLVR